MDSAWKPRVEARIDQLGLNMKSVSRRAKKGETFVRDILKRDRDPSIEAFIALAHALETTVSWLATGEGDESDQFADTSVEVVGSIGADPSGAILYADGDAPREFVPAAPGGSRLDKAADVRGHSMKGLADDGSLIYFSEPRPPAAEYLGEVVVCEVDTGEVLVKKLLRGSEPSLFDLESINGTTRRDQRLRWIAEITAIIPPRQARRLSRREQSSDD